MLVGAISANVCPASTASPGASGVPLATITPATSVDTCASPPSGVTISPATGIVRGIRRSSASPTPKGIAHCCSFSSGISPGGGSSTSCGSASSLSKTCSCPTGIACSVPPVAKVMSARHVPVEGSDGVAV